MPAKKQKTSSTSSPATAAAGAASASGTRFFDVAKPGSLAPADATARPVIVTNRVVMQDPMMVAQPAGDAVTPATETTATETPAKSPQKIVIKPLTEKSTDVDADGVLEPAETKSASDTAPTPPLSASARMTESDIASDDSAQTSDPVGTPGLDEADPGKQVAKLEADAKAQEELDKLVEEKTYFLPINAVVQRRSRHVFIFGTILILILAAAWLDIALDAGFVTIPGVQPLTHIFHN